VSSENDSHYKYIDFMADCLRDEQLIKLYPDVRDDAKKFFKIRDKTDLLSVIGNDELEKRRFSCKSKHRKNPNIIIDEYLFTFNSVEGYMAFFYQNNKWTIKSFHESAFTIGDISKSQKMLEVLKSLGLNKNYRIEESK